MRRLCVASMSLLLEILILQVECQYFQNVEESECRRAYEVAVRTYTESFDKSIPPEEVQLSTCGLLLV